MVLAVSHKRKEREENEREGKEEWQVPLIVGSEYFLLRTYLEQSDSIQSFTQTCHKKIRLRSQKFGVSSTGPGSA